MYHDSYVVMYFLSLENDMQKTEHQRRMEYLAEDQLYEATRAADASAEAARQARIQADIAERQADIAERQAEFQRNVMILEAADDDERYSFFIEYREDELSTKLKETNLESVENVFKDIRESKFVEALNKAKQISQRLQEARVAVADAEKNYSEGELKYVVAIGFAVLAAYILYDSISMAFYGFNPFGFWTILSAVYMVFVFMYHQSWRTVVKIDLESKISSAKSDEIDIKNELKNVIAAINSIWIYCSESEIKNSFIKVFDPRSPFRITAEHINKVQKDFPANCRFYKYDALLNDPNNEKWSIHEVTPDQIISLWNTSFVLWMKEYILDYYYLREWGNELLPELKVIS